MSSRPPTLAVVSILRCMVTRGGHAWYYKLGKEVAYRMAGLDSQWSWSLSRPTPVDMAWAPVEIGETIWVQMSHPATDPIAGPTP